MLIQESVSEAGMARIKIIILVVIITLGLLAVLFALNSARFAAANENRVADVVQIQEALRVFHDQNGYYPYGNGTPEGIQEYLDHWPVPGSPAGSCSKVNDVYFYTQKSGGSDYNLNFCLSAKASGLGAGVHIVNSQGVVQ